MHDQNIKGEKRMVIQEKKRSGRVSSFVLDTLHVIVGILIVILAVLAFLNPDENRILFPALLRPGGRVRNGPCPVWRGGRLSLPSRRKPGFGA